jgi:hypothetical protein
MVADPSGVFVDGDCFEVVWVDASLVVAEVVNDVSLRDFPFVDLVGVSVDAE